MASIPERASVALRLATTAIALLLFFEAKPAEGLQFYFFFEAPYSRGGSGNEFFTGSPRYKRFDCSACHVGAPREIRVDLRTEPENVFDVGYRPGETYRVFLALEEELRAPAVKILNTNSFCVEAIDGSGRQAGQFDPGFPYTPISKLFDPVSLSTDGTTIIGGFLHFDLVSNWLWEAPPEGTGPVTFYGGYVDGNGDLKTFGDDVATIRKTAAEIGDDAP